MRDEQLADQRLRVARDPERLAAFERGLAEGGYEGAQRALGHVLAARFEKGQYSSAPGIAMRYLDAGDKDRAMTWLYKGVRDARPEPALHRHAQLGPPAERPAVPGARAPHRPPAVVALGSDLALKVLPADATTDEAARAGNTSGTISRPSRAAPR